MGDKRRNLSSFRLSSSSLQNQVLSIDEELWRIAEERAQEILYTIQPNVLSEVTRKEVIDFVQRQIGGYYGVEVFPFGSVPLKTYLPDGDVDLTVLTHENVEDEMAKSVCSIFENSNDPDFPVKDTQYIRAQVQLVKCNVKNIAVDISFNQMAGLYTLRFLEQVDQLVGRDHIFKRSIILIKSWLYYESRLLGAHHGLLSTYAVEVLVLYIINHHHSSVRGPLEVLYRFLEFYGKFDWDKNYASIDGPKPLSSLPEIVETPECDRAAFLLQKEFLKNYRDLCSFSAKASDTAPHDFIRKFMNILDPLRDDNNLGRSVNKANLYRIKFAFLMSARRLKKILELPGESMGRELENFFLNTLMRNGKGERPDVDIPVPAFGTGKCEQSVLDGDGESYYGGLQYIQLYRQCAVPGSVTPSSPLSAEADAFAPSLQPNWNMFYQMGTDVYIPGQPFYYANVPQGTYSLEEMGKSRGTGTYIPDLAYNAYWDTRVRAPRPRRMASPNHNAMPKSPVRKQQVEEVAVHSESKLNADSKPFELTGEDFPLLPGNRKATPAEAEESAQSVEAEESAQSVEVVESAAQVSAQLMSVQLESRESAPVAEVQSETVKDAASKSFQLSNEDFPVLPSTRRRIPSEAHKPARVTKQTKASFSSQLNISFGSLPTKDDKQDSAGATTMVAVPKEALTMMMKEEEARQGGGKME